MWWRAEKHSSRFIKVSAAFLSGNRCARCIAKSIPGVHIPSGDFIRQRPLQCTPSFQQQCKPQLQDRAHPERRPPCRTSLVFTTQPAPALGASCLPKARARKIHSWFWNTTLSLKCDFIILWVLSRTCGGQYNSWAAAQGGEGVGDMPELCRLQIGVTSQIQSTDQVQWCYWEKDSLQARKGSFNHVSLVKENCELPRRKFLWGLVESKWKSPSLFFFFFFFPWKTKSVYLRKCSVGHSCPTNTCLGSTLQLAQHSLPSSLGVQGRGNSRRSRPWFAGHGLWLYDLSRQITCSKSIQQSSNSQRLLISYGEINKTSN